jgi:hypothetical protein
MKCLIWRQHRGQLMWVGVVAAIGCGVMAVVRHSAEQWLADYAGWIGRLRAAGCPLPGLRHNTIVHTPTPGCRTLLARYPNGSQDAFTRAYNFAIPALEEGLPLLMVVLGVLIGAPLVAREIEQRTQVVAWTQSVSRGRWYVIKTGVLAAGLAVVGLIAGFVNDRAQTPLTAGGLTSTRWIWFFSIDLAPAAEAVVAFALAVALGAVLRRTLAAIGAALVGFLALFVVSAWAIRTLTPTKTASGGVPDDGWGVGGGAYHPAGQYWPLQVVYLAALLAVATALFALGWRATRPRSVV